MKNIIPAKNEQVRLGTLLAHRQAEAFAAFRQIQRPLLAETPARRDNAPSVLNFPLWFDRIAMPDVLMSRLAQCMLGSWCTEPTEIMNFLMLLVASVLSEDTYVFDKDEKVLFSYDMQGVKVDVLRRGTYCYSSCSRFI